MRTRLFFAAVAIVAVISVAGYLLRGGEPAPAARGESTPATPVAPPTVDRAPDDGSAARIAERDRVLQAYFEPLRFRDDIEAFLATLDERTTEDNLARAGQLGERIRAQQQAGYLTHAQALYLEGTLLTRTLADDAAARAAALDQLEADYAALAPEPSTAHLDARFNAYKQREAEVVQRVLAGEIPAGMSRDDYLREQLDALRTDIYGEGE